MTTPTREEVVQWAKQSGFTDREYDSDETEENEFRECVLSALATYKESKQ